MGQADGTFILVERGCRQVLSYPTTPPSRKRVYLSGRFLGLELLKGKQEDRDWVVLGKPGLQRSRKLPYKMRGKTVAIWEEKEQARP